MEKRVSNASSQQEPVKMKDACNQDSDALLLFVDLTPQ